VGRFILYYILFFILYLFGERGDVRLKDRWMCTTRDQLLLVEDYPLDQNVGDLREQLREWMDNLWVDI
jgi:hypothetical protein